MRMNRPLEVHKRATLTVLLLAAAVFYAIFMMRTTFRVRGELYFTLIDDAMVSMRYAQHLAQGYGLTWNIGEKPIEGFTNPAWMLLMVPAHIFHVAASKTSLPVMVLSGLCLLGTALAAYKLCGALSGGARYAPLIAAGITAFYFPLVFWSMRGMEVGFLTLLVELSLLCALSLVKGKRLAISALLGLLFVLALAVRMDSVLQLSIILAYVIVSQKPSLHRAAIPLAALILALAGILCFQHAYFGDFLPNTFYQKVVGASISERLRNGIVVFAEHATRDTLVLVLFSIASIMLHRGLKNRETAVLAGLFVVQCLYSVWVGGDYAEPEVDAANRFITQGMPFLIVLFSLGVERIIASLTDAQPPERPGVGFRGAAIAVGIAFAVLLVVSGKPWMNWIIHNAPLLKADIRRVRIGLSIAEHTSSAATIAVHAAGQIPYYSGRRTIDLLGLNDRVIARGPMTGPFYPGHDKWNYDYSILQLRPDLIADNWIRLGEFMKGNADYGQLDNGMYVRRDSALVDVPGLLQPVR